MPEFDSVDLDVLDETQIALIDIWIKEHLSDASINLFEKEASATDLEQTFRAAGRAVFNESVIDALKQQIEKTEDEKNNTNATA